MTPDVTAAVVSYRTPKLAEQCLASIQRNPVNMDTVCVETGTGRLASFGADRAYSTSIPSVGYAQALAHAFKGVTTPFLMAMNADTELPIISIAPLLELFADHPKLGLLGPRQVTPDGRIAHAGILKAGDTSGGRSYGERDVGQYKERLTEVEQVSGSVMILRRSALEAVGGFTNLPTLYYEEALLALRLRRAGWKVAYSGQLSFLHHVAASPAPEGTSRAALAEGGRQAWLAELNG